MTPPSSKTWVEIYFHQTLLLTDQNLPSWKPITLYAKISFLLMKIFHARKQGNEKKKTKRYYLSRKLVYGNFGPKIETGCMDEKRGWI